MLSRLILLLLTAFCLSPVLSTADTTMSASMSTRGVDSTLTFSGTIQGRQYKDYPFKAGAGQRIDISYRSDHSGSYFNVLPPRSVRPLFVGSRMGNRFAAVLPEAGEYLIRVYLSGHAAERNESAHYQLQVRVVGR